MGCGCNKKSTNYKPGNIPDVKRIPRQNIIKKLWEKSKKASKSVNVSKINKK